MTSPVTAFAPSISLLAPRSPTTDDIAELTRLHRAVRYLDAYRFSLSLTPPEEWTDTTAILLAGRLFSCWGDWGRSNRLHFRAWRRAPTDPAAIYFYALTIEHKHGPFEALRFLHDHRAHTEAAQPELYHVWNWLSRARLLATFRDFEAADALIRRAEPHAADDPWFWVEKSRICETQDRYDEALAAAEKALALRPNYRPSIETAAHLFMLGNRDADALALLQRSVETLQAANLAQSLAVLLSELERHAESLAALDRATEWWPCADKNMRAWLAARRSDTLRLLGRDAEAAEQARASKFGFHEHIAKRLDEPAADSRRVLLRVEFVRQHHMTCAPATLAAIGRYWRRPVDHLELARTICYDGTPDHEERHWAESNGWIVREFRVTWEAAVALLERGCPFTLTTVAIRSAHLQAVVGFDARLGLLLIRDPYQRTHGECIAKTFLEAAAAHGPRGMVLVPPENAALLDGIELADAALYDQWFRLRRALLHHDRAGAQAAADALSAAAPEHMLALQAQRELAFYDGNVLRQLDTTRALLKRFPDEPNFQLDEAQLLRVAGHLQERAAAVEALGARRNAPSLFVREYVEMLTDDGRKRPQAMWLARRNLRRHATDAGNLRAFANLLWTQQRFTEATDLYRLAASVGDKVELHWDAFFTASRHTQQVDACLELLRQRDARLGAQSSQPVRTLFQACETLDRTEEGFAALAAVLARRPDDGELMLFTAEAHGRYGRFEEAARLVTRASERAPRPLLLRTRARIAEFRADHATALAQWRELLELNPIDVHAHKAAANLLAALEGRQATLGFLRDACARHPRHIGLHNTLLEWLRSEAPEEPLAVADHLLSLDPANAWVMREKAIVLRRHARAAEALLLAETARRIEPTSPFSAAILGLVLLSLGRQSDAHEAFRDALRLGVDCGYMDQLLETAPDFAARKSAVEFLQAEFTRQAAIEGGAFLRFRELARAVITPAELRQSLETLLAAHRANWGAWSALGAHLLDQNEIDAALAQARDTVTRFPLVPRTWLDLAAVQARARQPQAEIESLQRALELSPSWGHASRELSATHERALQLDAAEHVLRRALAADPLDAISHGWLADLLWRRDRKEDAVALLERAITLEPGYEWAWQRFDQWSRVLKTDARVASLAEALTQKRPGEARAWLRLAQIQGRDATTALATLEKALAIDPRNVDALDFRVRLLVEAARYDEALAACRPAAFGDRVPHELLGRAAWLEHQRGNATKAIADMRALVGTHPDYAWGWGCLTEWCWDANQPKETAEAAAKWAWLAPQEPVPLGYLAAAQQRMGQRREAKDSYWRALHCNPAYSYGAQMLLQLLAEDRELEEAARVLRLIETHLSPADAQRAAVNYHIMRTDRVAAGKALAGLARVDDTQIHLLQEAARALMEAGWIAVIEDSLRPLLGDAATNPAVGRIWANAFAKTKRWSEIWFLDRTAATEPLRLQAWGATVESMGSNLAVWWLRWVRFRRGEWLHRATPTWGSMGYAYVTARMTGAAVRWLRDWRERADVEPWMLHNLTVAHYTRGDPDLALAVIEHALSLKPDHTRSGFLIWRGLESVLRGDAAASARALAETDNPAAAEVMKLERAMLEILVNFENELPASRHDALRRAKQRFKAQWTATPAANSDATLLNFRARVLRHLGRAAGSWLTSIQSRLPPAGRRYNTGSATQFALSHWWLIWIALVVIGAVARSVGR